MSKQKQIVEILETLSGKVDINLTDELKDDLGFDSLGMVSLLIEIEDAFDIVLEESDMNPYDLTTAEDVLKLVDKYCEDSDE